MRLFLSFLIFFSCLVAPKISRAFLPPEFFVQGLASIGAVIAGGIAVALVPFIIFFKFIKTLWAKHKKIILFIFIQNIIIAVALGFLFYYKFYKPLYEDSYLFSAKNEEGTSYDIAPNSSEANPTKFNENYATLDGILRDNNLKAIDENYGLTTDEIKNRIDTGQKVYFIDIREPEEYEAGYIVGAKHKRYMDLKDNLQIIKELFSLDESALAKGLFVIYCHDGNRGLLFAESANQENIKYLIGGAEALYDFEGIEYTGSALSDKAIFDKKYQYKFQTKAQDAIKIIKEKNAFVVDMRHPPVYARKHIKDSLSMKMSMLTTEEYNRRLKKILENRNKEFILIASRYSELFYANLLILRLERDHEFTDNQFCIVFHQFEELEKNPDIKFESSD